MLATVRAVTLPLPRHRYLSDGRLLRGYYDDEDVDSVQLFRIGRDDLTLEEGLALLDAECLQRNGRLRGPLVEPPVDAQGRRRW